MSFIMDAIDYRPLVTLAALNLAAAMSPGPAFVLITRTAAASGRSPAFKAAAGTVLASVIWAAAAVLGLQIVFAKAAGVYRLLELVGGIYLALIGIAMWRHAPDVITTETSAPTRDRRGAFGKGLLLGLSNPKVVVFFGTIFATALSPSASSALKWAALLVVLCNETAWYGFLALCFGSRPVQRVYRRIKTGLERLFGVLLFSFGAKLVWSGAHDQR
jgi:threonine/homoserine/homoserine lactone efflux protein